MAGEMLSVAGREEVSDFSIHSAGRVKRRFKPLSLTDEQRNKVSDT